MSEENIKAQRPDAQAAMRVDKDAPEGGARARGKRRRKVSYLTLHKIDFVDYKEINILRRFLNDRFKILPSRQSGNTAKQQRMIASAIRKAREMALLPFVVSEIGPDRRDSGPRRSRRDDDYNSGPRESGPREPREPRESAAPAPQASPEATTESASA